MEFILNTPVVMTTPKGAYLTARSGYHSTGNSLIQTFNGHNDLAVDVNKMCTMIEIVITREPYGRPPALRTFGVAIPSDRLSELHASLSHFDDMGRRSTAQRLPDEVEYPT